ncbi:hypothetical protein FRC01_001635 [Tulasnella sp. 417]|nr:hypothetical protein FRC01_001635 [Tulasnella sp. 417]
MDAFLAIVEDIGVARTVDVDGIITIPMIQSSSKRLASSHPPRTNAQPSNVDKSAPQRVKPKPPPSRNNGKTPTQGGPDTDANANTGSDYDAMSDDSDASPPPLEQPPSRWMLANGDFSPARVFVELRLSGIKANWRSKGDQDSTVVDRLRQERAGEAWGT